MKDGFEPRMTPQIKCISMKLFILRPKENTEEWIPWYDKCFGHIVCASNEIDARQMASNKAGDEGEEAWLDENISTCEELKATKAAEYIMRDFASA